MTYAVVSDIHAHIWSTFATTLPNGVNSRLQIILDELLRAAKALKKAGGDTLVIAGDIFHVRGSVDPEVLNPVHQAIVEILDMGIYIHAIPGNHDLKGADTTELGSAIEFLSRATGSVGHHMSVHNEPGRIDMGEHLLGFVPWRHSNEALLADLEKLAKTKGSDKADIFIHAGINDVLPGLDHSLDAKTLAGFGFRRVFAGHYHNHKVLGGGVYSIGATTHQTWGDVGTKAGFLIADSAEVTFFNSQAPAFVDVSGHDEAEMTMLADGNYVRFRGPAMTTAQQTELRQFLLAAGARGISIDVPKAVTAVRASSSVGSGRTLGQSVTSYIEARTDLPAHVPVDEVKKRAADVLARSQAVATA